MCFSGVPSAGGARNSVSWQGFNQPGKLQVQQYFPHGRRGEVAAPDQIVNGHRHQSNQFKHLPGCVGRGRGVVGRLLPGFRLGPRQKKR